MVEWAFVPNLNFSNYAVKTKATTSQETTHIKQTIIELCSVKPPTNSSHVTCFFFGTISKKTVTWSSFAHNGDKED